jgi:hypothetical protein
MKRQAHRQLGNFMVRNAGSTLGKAFSRWKLMARSLTKRQHLMTNVVEHWRKYQFLYVRNCFKTWISNSKMHNMSERKRHVLIEQNE